MYDSYEIKIFEGGLFEVFDTLYSKKFHRNHVSEAQVAACLIALFCY